MNRGLVVLLGVAFHLSVTMAVFACKNPQEEIVWLKLLEDASKQPIFIPEKLLQEVEWSKLPLTERDHSNLESAVRRPEFIERRKAEYGREESLCFNRGAPRGDEGGFAKDAKGLRAWIRDSDLSVIGRVDVVVPGWDTRRGKVAQMAYVRVLEVLRKDSDEVKPGDTVLHMLPYGTMHLKGTQICLDAWINFKVPVAGDEILLIGRPFWSDPRYFEFAFMFPIEDGLVRYQPYVQVKQFSPVEPNDIF